MSVGQLRLDTYTDLATAIAQTWHGGPSATVWEDVLASNDVDLRIGEHDRPHPAECACRPVVVPCSCPLGERAKKQHAAIERRRAARSAWTDSTTPPRDWTEIGSPDDADYSAAPLPLEPPADDGAFYDQEQF